MSKLVTAVPLSRNFGSVIPQSTPFCNPTVRTSGKRTVQVMTKAFANFAGLAASVDTVLDANVMGLVWASGDIQTLRRLACRKELPLHLQRYAATHENIEVRASFAANPAAEPHLLDVVAVDAVFDNGIASALIANPHTSESTLLPLVAASGRELALLALQRQGNSNALKAIAGARLAMISDQTTVRASRQLIGLLGQDPVVHEAVLRAAPVHALGFVHAAITSCGSHPKVQDAFVDWVDKYSKDLVRGDYSQLQSLLAEYGSRNTTPTRQRRWALGHLNAWNDRVIVEAVLSHESGDIASLVGHASTVSAGLEFVSHLAGRLPDTYLASLVADAAVALVGSDIDRLQNIERHVRKIFNPVISGAMRELEARNEIDGIMMLVGLAGIRHVDALVDAWPVVDRLRGNLEGVAALEVAKQNPRQILDMLRPLGSLLRLGSPYMEAMLSAISELEPGSPAWQTAAVLAPSWEGNLLELLHAARSLGADDK